MFLKKIIRTGVAVSFSVMAFVGNGFAQTTEQEQPVPRVYVGGSITGKSTIWVDGNPQILSHESSVARSVFATENNVYAAGVVNLGQGQAERAALWVNGAQTILGNTRSAANSVFVIGDDIYVAGKVGSSQANERATLWINGNPHTLSNSPSSANAVYVSGSDVYVAGEIHEVVHNVIGEDGLRSVATLWVNGVPSNLQGVSSTAISNSRANSIHVSGNNVYLLGRLDGNGILWRNGVPQNVGGFATSVYVSGNDVYVVGTVGNDAVIWRNGIPQSIGRGSPQSVYAARNNVYVAGFSGPTAANYRATLWTNGRPRELSNVLSMAISVFVYLPLSPEEAEQRRIEDARHAEARRARVGVQITENQRAEAAQQLAEQAERHVEEDRRRQASTRTLEIRNIQGRRVGTATLHNGTLTVNGITGDYSRVGELGFGPNPPWHAFRNEITNLVVENNESIGHQAFRDLTNLRTIHISSTRVDSFGRRYIGKNAFSGCTNVTSIRIEGNVVPSAQNNSFPREMTQNACLYVPASSIDAYRRARVWRNFQCIE